MPVDKDSDSIPWETVDQLPTHERALVIHNTFKHWLAHIAQAKLHWSIFLSQYNSTLKPDHPDYELLTKIICQWTTLLGYFDSTKGLTMFHISCVEQVDQVFDFMKEGMASHFSEVSPLQIRVHSG